MSRFSYKAQLVATGGEVTGEGEATDKFELAKNLKSEGKMLLSAKEISGSSWNMDKINAMLSKVDLREKIVFSNNLATMIAAGLPISRALNIIWKQTQNPKLKIVLTDLIDQINKGSSFSDSMAKHSDIFPAVMISMVRAGEESGGLVESLRVVGSQMEKTYTIQKKVKGAMMYPAVVVAVMIGVGVLMMIYVVPGLASTFAEAHVELPPLTKAFIGVADFLQNKPILAAGAAIGFAFGVTMMLRTKTGQKSTAWLATRIPVFGKLVKQYNSAIVTRTLASLISAGVDILRSIDITTDVVGNMYYKKTLKEAREAVQKGVPLSQTFVQHTELYPVVVGDMMEVGEETGQLSEMLKKIAMFFEDEVDQATGDMSKLMEPLLMVLIAAFVGMFAMAMITPMYSIMTTIG
jgi:type IV pilus assembly protein PilC